MERVLILQVFQTEFLSLLYTLFITPRNAVTAARPRAKTIFGRKLCGDVLACETPASNIWIVFEILRSLADDFADRNETTIFQRQIPPTAHPSRSSLRSLGKNLLSGRYTKPVWSRLLEEFFKDRELI
jgi:hypothetical protein